MPKRAGWTVRAALLALAVVSAGCTGGPGSSASFERSLSVSGPLRLELVNGSGSVQISAGEPGLARIRGEVRASGWVFGDVKRRIEEIASSPPIEGQGNLIRVGSGKTRDLMRSMTLNYTIVVPPETEVETQVGSGSVEVRDIHGPAKLTTGSGGISVANLREDAQVLTGSGGITLTNVAGEVRATAGSGGITMSQIQGEIRAATGSGGITIAEPGGRISAKTGSGGVTVSGAAADLRAKTGSGSLTIEGNPAPDSYWELHTGSGGIAITVPASASFRFHAHSNSGRIEPRIPVVIEEQRKHELRARVGSGAARVEAETGSGNIQIR